VYEEDTRPRDEEWSEIRVPGTVVVIPNSPYPDVNHEVCYIGNDSVSDWLKRVAWLEERFKPDFSAAIHYAEARAALSRFAAMRMNGRVDR
jgi:hypothetical protein